MINLVALTLTLASALNPIKVHVDGSGYMRFVRDGRVVYAKTATFVNIDGALGAEGAKVLPEVQIPANATTLKIDLQGNIDAGENHLGRLVLAIFPAGSTSTSTDSFFMFSERPSLTNPGEETAGVIRVDGDPTPPIIGHAPVRPTSKETDPAPSILTHSTTPATTVNHTTKKGGGQGVEILVHQHSDVSGGDFTIGDIAAVTGPDETVDAIKKIKIGATTIAGFSRPIDAKSVTMRLRGSGIKDGTYSLIVPDGAEVARKTKTISTDEIADMAIKAAQEKIGTKVDFRVAIPIKPIVANDAETILEASDPEQTAKGYTVVVTARQGNTIVGFQTVNLTMPAQAGGIKVGDVVKVVIKSNLAFIEVQGKALSAGFVGQKIKVSITASSDGTGTTTTHTGTVIDAGKVEVDL